MIVSSNAFVFSTSLLVVVFRYGVFEWIFSFLVNFIIPMLFSRTFYSIMFLHSFLIIISFRLNLETDSLSHKLKARGPCKGFECTCFLPCPLFRYSCQHSHLGYYCRNAQWSAIITYVIMKICLYLYCIYLFFAGIS